MLGCRPLLAGLGAFTATSIACAFAPSIATLGGLRAPQGVAGAARIVIAWATVRDLSSGIEAARLFGLLLLVTGVAPILAPLVCGQLLGVTESRGIFMVLAATGLVLLVAAARVVF